MLAVDFWFSWLLDSIGSGEHGVGGNEIGNARRFIRGNQLPAGQRAKGLLAGPRPPEEVERPSEVQAQIVKIVLIVRRQHEIVEAPGNFQGIGRGAIKRRV